MGLSKAKWLGEANLNFGYKCGKVQGWQKVDCESPVSLYIFIWDYTSLFSF